MLDMMFKLKINADDFAFVRFCSEDNAGKYLIFENDGIIYHRKLKSKLTQFDGNEWNYLGIYMELYLDKNRKELFGIDKLKIIDALGINNRINYLTKAIVDMKDFMSTINPDIKILTMVEEEDET